MSSIDITSSSSASQSEDAARVKVSGGGVDKCVGGGTLRRLMARFQLFMRDVRQVVLPALRDWELTLVNVSCESCWRARIAVLFST